MLLVCVFTDGPGGVQLGWLWIRRSQWLSPWTYSATFIEFYNYTRAELHFLVVHICKMRSLQYRRRPMLLYSRTLLPFDDSPAFPDGALNTRVWLKEAIANIRKKEKCRQQTLAHGDVCLQPFCAFIELRDMCGHSFSSLASLRLFILSMRLLIET